MSNQLIRNPLGKKVSLGNGYAYQRVAITKGGGYVKLWFKGEVIDRATSVTSARAMAKRYAQRSLLDG